MHSWTIQLSKEYFIFCFLGEDWYRSTDCELYVHFKTTFFGLSVEFWAFFFFSLFRRRGHLAWEIDPVYAYVPVRITVCEKSFVGSKISWCLECLHILTIFTQRGERKKNPFKKKIVTNGFIVAVSVIVEAKWVGEKSEMKKVAE